ncbi:hypothetical protein CTER_1524 [Ruminiclostridium cellobioparum subsp. termitidis CT1112]|uniref:Uncharacterized protein n=1 Tax=Ruminiclostridium cellobioparum subsp. termitidis CT1112 TaxID=1195236 RepID=S0FQK4_RUMCE|nr:hypothetical protein CTER_1524 [Ruminiclostridium cellobioparum subsp. termitidis CT1112]
MFFKPRIFLSSTLNENLSIRSKIEDFFPELELKPCYMRKI